VDGDGLTAAVEVPAGASPFLPDTDGDGLDDAAELNPPPGTPATNPASRDSDGDGLLDAEEIAAGQDGVVTNPWVADSDGDAIPDGQDGTPLDKLVFYHGDHLGSATSLTNHQGTELARVLYKPFGAAVGGAPPTFGFTGQRFEAEVGLYDYGARWYDPVLGRFLSPDSLVPEPGDPQSLNRYAYVRNSPLSRIDPSGSFDFGSFFGGIGSFFGNYLINPVAQFSTGLASGIGYGLGISGSPSGSGFFFDQGVGLGSLAAATIGIGIDLLATPLAVGGNLLGLGASDATRPAIGGPLSDIGQGILTRVDELAVAHPSLFGTLARDDVAGFGTGLLATPIGLSQGLGNVLEGAFTMDGQGAMLGALQFANALIPRYGRFAGPGHGRFDLSSPFSNPIDIYSRQHDLDRGDDTFPNARDDRILADALRNSYRATPFLGPTAQIYRAGEFLLFEALARIGHE
jgi:RHS repeat-associated protein